MKAIIKSYIVIWVIIWIITFLSYSFWWKYLLSKTLSFDKINNVSNSIPSNKNNTSNYLSWEIEHKNEFLTKTWSIINQCDKNKNDITFSNWQIWSCTNVYSPYVWTDINSYWWLYKFWNNTNISDLSNVRFKRAYTDITNWVINKKWPCLKWYHIPSKEEWESLVWELKNSEYQNSELFSILKLPFAWYRNYVFNTVIDNNNSSTWYYWTSTLSESGIPYYFNLNKQTTSLVLDKFWKYSEKDLSLSIRCIKDHLKELGNSSSNLNCMNEKVSQNWGSWCENYFDIVNLINWESTIIKSTNNYDWYTTIKCIDWFLSNILPQTCSLPLKFTVNNTSCLEWQVLINWKCIQLSSEWWYCMTNTWCINWLKCNSNNVCEPINDLNYNWTKKISECRCSWDWEFDGIRFEYDKCSYNWSNVERKCTIKDFKSFPCTMEKSCKLYKNLKIFYPSTQIFEWDLLSIEKVQIDECIWLKCVNIEIPAKDIELSLSLEQVVWNWIIKYYSPEQWTNSIKIEDNLFWIIFNDEFSFSWVLYKIGDLKTFDIWDNFDNVVFEPEYYVTSRKFIINWSIKDVNKYPSSKSLETKNVIEVKNRFDAILVTRQSIFVTHTVPIINIEFLWQNEKTYSNKNWFLWTCNVISSNKNITPIIKYINTKSSVWSISWLLPSTSFIIDWIRDATSWTTIDITCDITDNVTNTKRIITLSETKK